MTGTLTGPAAGSPAVAAARSATAGWAFDTALGARLAGGVAAGPDAARVSTFAPFTGEPLAHLPVSDAGAVADAFARARLAGGAWAAWPARERARVLLRFHDLLLARQAEALDLVQWESGKARRHALEEVVLAASTARYYAHTAPGALRPRRRAGVVPGFTRVVEHRHPKGVVAVVSPWNYPLAPGTSDQIPALVAGNAVVHKPDNQSALTALWARDLMVEAGLPAEAWQIVIGAGRTLGPWLVEHADYLCFTGSTPVGRTVAEAAARHLIGVSLELGGKNAALVLADADLDGAVEGLVRASFSSAGQMCVAMERIYLERPVYEDFAARFAARTAALRVGTGFGWDLEVGSLTTPSQLERVTAHVEDAVALGATVLAGGHARPDLGRLVFEPTILAGVTDAMTCASAETFGPVVALYPVASVDEAVERHNATPYGLNASIWTRDLRVARRLATRLRAGTVNVNDGYAAAFGSVDSPMGGMGDSGLGRRNGLDGLLKHTEAQTVAVQRGLALAPPAGVPYERFAGGYTVLLRALRRVGAR